MAFLPARDTYYRIYAKHSGKCVTIRNASPHRGEPVVQRAMEPDAAHQLFSIRPMGEDHFAITAKNSNHNLDVARASHDDGAALIQWERSDHVWNEHFRFVRAGDGFYKLQVCHSNKYIVPRDQSSGDVDFVQSSDAGGDFAKFKLVADGAAYDSITGRDLVTDTSEMMRTAVLGIIGFVPEVGSGIKFLTGFLWPAQDAGMLVWSQMKRFVTDLVREMIAQERVIELGKKLAGLRNLLRSYESTSFGSDQKAQFFTSLLAEFDLAEPYFFDPRNPEQQLPYFVALGTLHLATLREQCVSYEKIYGKPDPDEAKHLELLQTKIREYTAAAKTSRARAMKWRADQIGVEHTTETTLTRVHVWTAFDRYDGWRASWQYNSTTGGHYDAEQLARASAANRLQQVRGGWGSELERFLAPAFLWKYLDPTTTEKPKRMPVDITTGPWGGGREREFADDPNGQPITSVVIHAGTRVDGVEIFYGGVSGGLHGQVGGERHQLDLEPGEKIVGVRVRGGEGVDFLQFETNHGRWVGGGGRGGVYVIGDPPDEAGASLYRIFGRQGTRHVAAIGCTWRYHRDE
ncbi:MAG TPA: RICIN domain-containing protein [Thermoanaerobaculia bacterium]|nr:RICIN domain-containing protein [Thermoanaerobaculia bacterium]